jgi:hypothetical protein
VPLTIKVLRPLVENTSYNPSDQGLRVAKLGKSVFTDDVIYTAI